LVDELFSTEYLTERTWINTARDADKYVLDYERERGVDGDRCVLGISIRRGQGFDLLVDKHHRKFKF